MVGAQSSSVAPQIINPMRLFAIKSEATIKHKTKNQQNKKKIKFKTLARKI
jgi:hypothetical protein